MENDILTAECTLLTVISILTGLWYNDIVQANQMDVKKTDGYRDERRKLRSITWWKTFPLMVLSVLSTLVFVKTSCLTIKEITSWSESPIKVSVVIVNTVLAVLAIVFATYFIKFICKLNQK